MCGEQAGLKDVEISTQEIQKNMLFPALQVSAIFPERKATFK